VKLPEILSVPFVIVRNAIGVPSTTVPCTDSAAVVISRMFAFDVPLLIVSVRRSVVAPAPPNVALPAPVNVSRAPDVFADVLRSSVPSFVRLPPTDSV
jgi:hypothetical protein